MDKEPKVSIIIPVYNVENYIEDCLLSVNKQTYKNIEVILLNDGSTDTSGDICDHWSKEYGYRYTSKENEGLGPTRNRGIELATGEFVTFLDSDDFLAEDAIQQFVDCARENDYPDVVVFHGYYEYDNITKQIREVVHGLKPGWCAQDELSHKKYLREGYSMACSKLYRKSFFVDNAICFPNMPHEDVAIFPQVALLADKIVMMNNSVYYYRVNREGSIITNKGTRPHIYRACSWALDYFMEKQLFQNWYTALKMYYERQMYITFKILREQEYSAEKLQKAEYDFNVCYEKYFGSKKKYWEYEFCLLGGFSSRWIIHSMTGNTRQLEKHYSFSGIIAQMTKNVLAEEKITNSNVFRREKIEEDFTGCLYNELSNGKKYDFMVIDFLSDCDDIARLQNGNYITLSEAYRESETENVKIEQIIKSGTEEFLALWKEKCRIFVKLLREKYEIRQIILIGAKLATCYKQEDCFFDFDNKTEIEQKNKMLSEMYCFFLELFEEKPQVYWYSDEVYATWNTKYGLMPQYLAGEFLKNMADKISEGFENAF